MKLVVLFMHALRMYFQIYYTRNIQQIIYAINEFDCISCKSIWIWTNEKS